MRDIAIGVLTIWLAVLSLLVFQFRRESLQADYCTLGHFNELKGYTEEADKWFALCGVDDEEG